MSIIKGKVNGLLYSLYPVFVIGGKNNVEWLVPVDRNGERDVTSWQEVERRLKKRIGPLNDEDGGYKGVTDAEMEKFVEDLKLEQSALEVEVEGGKYLGLIHAFNDMKIKIKGEPTHEVWGLPQLTFDNRWSHVPGSRLHAKLTMPLNDPTGDRGKFFNWRLYLKIDDKKSTPDRIRDEEKEEEEQREDEEDKEEVVDETSGDQKGRPSNIFTLNPVLEGEQGISCAVQ